MPTILLKKENNFPLFEGESKAGRMKSSVYITGHLSMLHAPTIDSSNLPGGKYFRPTCPDSEETEYSTNQ